MDQQRLPPQNIEAEQSVLGAMFLDKEAIAQAGECLTADDFYREAHKLIFAAMMELYDKNKAVDLITVTDALRENGRLEDIGGIAYLTGLANSVPTAANVRFHADIVQKKSVLRQLIRTATAIAAKGYDENDDVEELLDQAEANILEIAGRKRRNDFTLVGDLVRNIPAQINDLLEAGGGLTGLPSGYQDLDRLTSGLHPSDFIILAARPSMGKTALALNIAENVALRAHKSTKGQPRTVAFFSLEMSKEQLVHRMLCSEANVDSQRLRTGELRDEDWDSLWDACEALNSARIYIDDTPAITALEMRSKARRLKAEHGLDLIVVDYLQLMQGSGRRTGPSADNRQQEVSDISRSLKALARELDVPVLALSQLSRSVESRQVKRPLLSDLRESGSLEQDADIVAFLYREDYYNPDTENKNVTELIIAKHRNGPVDTIHLFFQKQYTKFLGFSKQKE